MLFEVLAHRAEDVGVVHQHEVTADGYHKLITHVFAEGDEYLETDAVFGVRSALIAPFVRDGNHWTMTYDLILAP